LKFGRNQLRAKYCELTLSEEQHLLKCVYSMILIIQINFLLYTMETGKNGVDSKRERGREREREEQIRRVRDRA
jgi:hypothetical protein